MATENSTRRSRGAEKPAYFSFEVGGHTLNVSAYTDFSDQYELDTLQDCETSLIRSVRSLAVGLCAKHDAGETFEGQAVYDAAFAIQALLSVAEMYRLAQYDVEKELAVSP